MRIHVVSYLPRGSRSSTRRLLETLRSEIDTARHQLDELDLTTDVPDLFLPERLHAYIMRDYRGESLDREQQGLMAGMDGMTSRLLQADALVLATPMHNFSMPAIVKAWFDAVMLKGHTWDVAADGHTGLLHGRAALVLASSGGTYDQTPFAPFEHLVSLIRCELQFLGFDPVHHVLAEGMNTLDEEAKEAALTRAASQTRAFAKALLAP
ncbi:MAG: FMN-dependent NADH-azoreductase [Planctomycetota bacterium]